MLWCLLRFPLLVRGHLPTGYTHSLLEEWTNKAYGHERQQDLQQFTRETGI